MDYIREIQNKIILLKQEILVFFIPYVIPIPNESILLEKAKINKEININNTS